MNNKKKFLKEDTLDNAIKDAELAKAVLDCTRLQMENVELVELKGYTRNEVNQLMCACNALLMTSKTEGSPQVVKEAMACGCPVVSVNVGDVEERIKGVDGCYVVLSRTPRDLSEALIKAITHEGKTNGRAKIIEYNLSNRQVAQQIMNIYKKILQR